MASTKLAFMAVAVLLLQASCAVARAQHHHASDPCGDSVGLQRHKDHGCSSPAVSAQGGTPAMMTVNSFEKGGSGGGPSECDGQYHSNKDLITALSTGWYAGGSRRCRKPIRITSTQTGRTVVAEVRDECDSDSGCEDNMVSTSQAVWDALGLDTNIGGVPVTWSDA
ncbi:putative ripening-related protein 6 [Miscanthus floridulus]|uniref:putative ripening-related protein 6 n=1 Tax=Miscanthus floridulus TaxID=154761 RepID=UPI003459D5B3